MNDEGFCPGCGQPTASSDRFCRGCGTSLQEEPAAAAEKAPGRRRGRVYLAVAALMLSAVAAASVLAAGGAFSSEEATPEQAVVDPRVVAQQRLAKPFDQHMALRDEFFAAERDYRAAMRSAQRRLREYRRADRDYKAELKRINEEFADEFDQCSRFNIPCPDPDYPTVPRVPSFKESTADLRGNVKDLSALQAKASALAAPDELRALNAQLVTAVTALREVAEHNGDVLSEAIEEPEYESASGNLNRGKIATLRSEDLPSIRVMNTTAAQIVRDLNLELARYDLPGGRDIDERDASQEL